MKKILCLVLATLLLLASAALAESPFTAEKPGKLTVAVFDRSNMDTSYGDSTNNYWSNWVKEQVLADLNIEVTFMALARSGSDSVLPVWMAAGNCPDIFFTYSSSILYDYAEQGGLYDLTDLIHQYAPTLTEALESTLSFGFVSGGQYAIPAKRGSVGHVAAFIRKDWCDRIGYELSYDEAGNAWISYEDLETVMAAWKEQGICEYPMAMLQEASTAEAESMDPFTHAFIDYSAITDQDIATLPDILWPGMKDGYAWLNKLYNNGLIQPDWAIYGDETEWKGWISNGGVGVWSHAYWRELGKNESVEALYANDPGAEVISVNVTNADGVAAMVDRYAPYGMYIMVPATSKNATEAVLYLDWLCEYDNFEYLQYGIESEHYTRNEDGTHNTTTAAADARKRISVNDLVLPFNGNPQREIAIGELTIAVNDAMKPIYEGAYY
ncbi:MAG TPA: extracellular solute-binding protein, partial [Clostridia bacterium]|nr:extracellular solute-binding protein [Clostridia bacterium]